MRDYEFGCMYCGDPLWHYNVTAKVCALCSPFHHNAHTGLVRLMDCFMESPYGCRHTREGLSREMWYSFEKLLDWKWIEKDRTETQPGWYLITQRGQKMFPIYKKHQERLIWKQQLSQVKGGTRKEENVRGYTR